MQACVQGQGSEIFVLDMGEPIKISYLAKQLIRMAGLIPGQDIEIVYTGLREGEKLVEELFHNEEKLEKTLHDQISLAESRALNSESIVNAVRLLTSKIQQSDTDGIEQIMKELVPEYMQRNLAEGTDSAQVISFSR
jgi:FlaA1/EpsC-like NDP-sugar epimerase